MIAEKQITYQQTLYVCCTHKRILLYHIKHRSKGQYYLLIQNTSFLTILINYCIHCRNRSRNRKLEPLNISPKIMFSLRFVKVFKSNVIDQNYFIQTVYWIGQSIICNLSTRRLKQLKRVHRQSWQHGVASRYILLLVLSASFAPSILYPLKYILWP